jgi:hypothetical protein
MSSPGTILKQGIATEADRMRDYTSQEKIKTIAGAIAAIVTVALLATIALGLLWMPPPA